MSSPYGSQTSNDTNLKETEIGLIPIDWDLIRLDTIASIKYGKSKPKQHGDIPVVGSGGVYSFCNQILVDYPTVVIGRKGSAGSVMLMEVPFWASDTTFYLDWLDDKADYRHIYHYLMVNPISGEHAKTTLPSLQKPDLGKLLIPLPPPPEQKAIVHILSTVQRAKEATQQVIQATKELKKSLMKHLFTYGFVSLEEAPNVKLKETELGTIPEEWELMKLTDLVIEGIKNGAFIKRDQFGSGVPFLNVADTYKGLTVNISELERVNCSQKDLQLYALKSDDLVYVRSSLKREGVGHCCIIQNVPEASIFDCHLMRVRLDKKELKPQFLAYYSNSPKGKNDLIARSKTTTMTTINQKGLGSFVVPVPPYEEQDNVSRILAQVDNKVQQEQNRLIVLDQLFKTLLNNLMTGKLRVDNFERQN